METLQYLINFILHLDHHLFTLMTDYGTWAYVILFLVIFSETGFVITPILPGDSLLFAAGTLSASLSDSLSIHSLFLLLFTASILGNMLNYFIGKYLGPRVFKSTHSRFLNPQFLQRAQVFYEKHGGKAIVIARFIPIIRTFAPFVAGVGQMHYAKFFFYNVVGALLWVGGLLYISYLFGNLPFVKNHFSSVVLFIITASLIPGVLAYFKERSLKMQ